MVKQERGGIYLTDFEYCSQNRGWQQQVEMDEPYLYYSCIWFKIYKIPRGLYDEEVLVWNWRRISAYRDKHSILKQFKIKLKEKLRRIRGSKRTDN